MNLFTSETKTVFRSEINPSSYNPRTISEEGRKQLKRSIKKYGIIGGIVINARTGNTIVGGHQKIRLADEIYKYPDHDYELKAEFIDVDEKTEKQINIILNNPNVGGDWDSEALAKMIPDIDYKDAGLTDSDLSLIGCDFLLQTQDELDIADSLDELYSPVKKEKEAVKEKSREEKAAHMKEVKAQVKEQAQKTAMDMDAYLMLSFDTYEAKVSFCERFGYDGGSKFIKGEDFDDKVELIIE